MTIKTVLEDIIQRTPDVKSFRFSRPSNFDYLAGQYLIIFLPDGKGGVLKKPLTISSSPTEDFIEVTKKITAGHQFSEAINSGVICGLLKCLFIASFILSNSLESPLHSSCSKRSFCI